MNFIRLPLIKFTENNAFVKVFQLLFVSLFIVN